MEWSPLPSWNDGPAKRLIVDFVANIVREGGDDYIPPSRRIATFDNDGTLSVERPAYFQLMFLRKRLSCAAHLDPSMRLRQPFKAFLEWEVETIAALGKRGALDVLADVHAGLSTDEFAAIARDWFSQALHPTFRLLLGECVFQPQIELLRFLRANSFKIFVVTSGSAEFMRAVSWETLGVPPENVIGTSVKTRVDLRNRRVEVIRLGELSGFNDRDAKVSNIELHIGKRPILAFGNSDADLPMLRYASSGGGLALLLHHDDANREFAYDKDFKLSPLAEGLEHARDYGIAVVSMKRDWKRVFSMALTASSRPSAPAAPLVAQT